MKISLRSVEMNYIGVLFDYNKMLTSAGTVAAEKVPTAPDKVPKIYWKSKN